MEAVRLFSTEPRDTERKSSRKYSRLGVIVSCSVKKIKKLKVEPLVVDQSPESIADRICTT